MLEGFILAVLIGLTATALADLWTLFQQRVLDIQGPNWALVGRWVGHMPQGRFVHASIAKAPALPSERVLGWATHYLTGIVFAAVLLALNGVEWVRQPVLLPALALGVATVLAPFLIMQPGMGLGIAASKTPNPPAARVRSLVAHIVFGVALYLAGLLWSAVLA
ncbi:DUF2938 domain-containing protein [Pseudomonas sp. JQ170]|uniref:DUF2938 domain-containing protein n=1 Tax=unclassified Pseudomonas TaxID=196821 RepID=UPI0026508510|nr:MULTISPECIES: DUF2938 domain-containing protein [unclassified Pseudomonas]MDN7142358.1 DUF2938 domain-containing protein [Pseudomonas sp. JQ170]WRO74077.1 DUF2938 domain-containing protein [Pseudomonas sp. 170C]